MWKASLVTVRHRVWQLVLSLLSIIIGVAAVGAVLSLNALVRTTTNGVVAATAADLNVLPDGALTATDAVVSLTALTDEHVAAIAEIPGVAAAHGQIRGTQLLAITRDGRVLRQQLAPTITGSYAPGTPYNGLPALAIGEGTEPTGPDEVVMDSATLARTGHEIGDTVTFARPGANGPIRATVTGVVTLGTESTAGASFALFSPAAAQTHFLAGQTGYNSVWVELDREADVDQGEVTAAIRAAVPNAWSVAPGSDVSSATLFQLHPRLTIAQVGLWIAGLLTLGVATALISTTVAHLVRRRRREAAFLRRLGASKFRTSLPVLAEALLLGLLGSWIALPLGQIIARNLNDVGLSHGLSLGAVIPPLSDVESWICTGVGVLVTLLVAHRHVTAASFNSPLETLPLLPSPRLRFSDAAWTSVGLVAVGVGLLVAATSVPSMPAPLAWAIIGAVVVLIGSAIAVPVLGAPAVRLIGLLARFAVRDVSTLAARNVTRHPARFAKAAAALVLGTGLVATFAVLGASGRVSAEHDVPANLHGDLFISSVAEGGFPREIAASAAALEQVESVHAYGVMRAVVDGDPLRVMVAEPETLEEMLTLEITDGRAPRNAEEVMVSAAHAARADIERGVGATLVINQDRAEVRVVGIYEAGRGIDAAEFVGYRDLFTSRGVADVDSLVSVTVATPTALNAVRGALQAAAQLDPLVRVQTPTALAESRGESLATISDTVGSLLDLLVLISVLGITGTLLIAVQERTPEIRALGLVGMDRIQVAGMIAIEAFLMGAVGGLLGTAAGTVAGWGLQQGLTERGYPLLEIPWPTLWGLVGIGAVVGLASAVLPTLVALRLPGPVAHRHPSPASVPVAAASTAS